MIRDGRPDHEFVRCAPLVVDLLAYRDFAPGQADSVEGLLGEPKYIKEKLALRQTTSDVTKSLSVENTLAIRRLEERFCLQFAQCLADPKLEAIVPGATLNSCLRDEALERYDVVPREEQ